MTVIIFGAGPFRVACLRLVDDGDKDPDLSRFQGSKIFLDSVSLVGKRKQCLGDCLEDLLALTRAQHVELDCDVHDRDGPDDPPCGVVVRQWFRGTPVLPFFQQLDHELQVVLIER